MVRETVLYFSGFLQSPASLLCGGALPPVSSLGLFLPGFFPCGLTEDLQYSGPPIFFFFWEYLINSLWNTAMMVPYAINRHMHIAIYYILVYGVATVGMGFLGAASIGLSGATLSLLVVEIAMAVIVIRITLQINRISIVEWVKVVLKPLLNFFEK